nr:MAG: putative holin [Bacteriophage sp.]
MEKSAVLFYFQHAHDCFIHYSITKEFLKMYIIIGIALICATIGFVVGSAVRWKIDYSAESIGALVVVQAQEDENPNLFLDLDEELVDFADKRYVVLKVDKVKPREKHTV